MHKVMDLVLYLLAAAVGVIVFQKFDVESILLDRADFAPVSQDEMSRDTLRDYAGMPAGDGVVSLDTIEQWDDVVTDSSFVTVTPRDIHKTDVSTLAKWESFFDSKRTGAAGRRRQEVTRGSLHMPLIYCPVYIIELPDGNCVLAQMSGCYAGKLAKGEKITLPLGTRRGMLEETRSLLADDITEYGTPDDYLLYTMNDEWQKEKADIILFSKLAAAIVSGIALAVVLEGIKAAVVHK